MKRDARKFPGWTFSMARFQRTAMLLLGLCLLSSAIVRGQTREPWMLAPPTSTGLAVGQEIPSLRAPDQNGRMQDFDSIRGPQGAAIFFMRSADW